MAIEAPMWMHSGHIFAKGDFTRRGPGTLHGVSGISTCPIRMATSCRLLARSNNLYSNCMNSSGVSRCLRRYSLLGMR